MATDRWVPRVALVNANQATGLNHTQAAGCDSYGLKHRVERWTHHIGMDTYVPQGALVTAALGMGFAYKQRPPYASQRVMLGVGRKHGMMGIIVR